MRPVRRRFEVTNPYGVPGPYAAGVHTGIDYGCPKGTVVRACRGGWVTTSAYDDDYGNYVIVRGRFRRREKAWLYAHLSKRFHSVGTKIRFGEAVGRSGDTGNTTGPHLHLEQRHYPFHYGDHERPTAARSPWRLPDWLKRR